MTCLGSGVYSATVRVVGTGAFVEEIIREDILSGTWNRTLSSTSTCTLSIGLTGNVAEKCCKYIELAKGIPAYELYLWRENNGDGANELVWKGPITELSLQPGNVVTLTAKDCSWWLSKRRFDTRTFGPADINTVAQAMADYGYGLNNPPNVVTRSALAGVTGEKSFTDADGSRVLDNITDMVRGLSYWTCVLNDFRIGLNCTVPITISDGDVAELPPLVWSADDFSTEVFGRTSNAAFAVAGGVSAARFGIPLLVTNIIDANTTTNVDALTFATQRLADMSNPGAAMEASNSSLTPSFDIGINELIPGCRIKTNFDGYCEPDPRLLWISGVEGSFNSSDEDIRLSLSNTVGDSADNRVSSV